MVLFRLFCVNIISGEVNILRVGIISLNIMCGGVIPVIGILKQ